MKRLVGESYEDYKARRKAADKLIKRHLKGRPMKLTKKEIVVP